MARSPLLYQLNADLRLAELRRELGRPATLADITDAELDRLADLGFDWLYVLGVWQTGPAARAISRSDAAAMAAYREELEDFTIDDVTGSPFAIQRYAANTDYGGPDALASLRERAATRGLSLMLDFVPNHVAPDHHWVQERPDFFVHGSEQQLADEPANWVRMSTGAGDVVLAYGRDPYFSGWSDTLQLDYGNADLVAAQRAELLGIAEQCDGLRCDMAMLLLPDVFTRTWGIAVEEFWPDAIAAVRAAQPGFTFMAEVYWDLEWELQQRGFDFTYDKSFYDRLRSGEAWLLRDHLRADADYQARSARFLENHDEPRAATVFPHGQHHAAATIAFGCRGLRFFHQGQLEGHRVHVSMHLGRAPAEPVDEELAGFYERLLAALGRPELQYGEPLLLDCHPAWDGNGSHDGFVAIGWRLGDRRALVAVNYQPRAGQCFVPLGDDFHGWWWVLDDLLGDARYERDGHDLATTGLYLDLPAWGHHLFAITER